MYHQQKEIEEAISAGEKALSSLAAAEKSLSSAKNWGIVDLLGGGSTDFRPAFAYVNQLVEEKTFRNLKGLLYFTDGKGIYPASRPPYRTAFLFMGQEEGPGVPAWAMKLTLDPEDFR